MEVKCEKVAERSENAVPPSTTPTPTTTSSWYAKFFEYWWNRNRVCPGKVKLPDCEFLVVGPRRTLRVLRPPLKSAEYYEHREGKSEEESTRAESLNDNFFARWSKRPHSSGNCRCSFRRASGLTTLDEQIISHELNRIRTSLCEAERTGHDIRELERRVSVNLRKLQVAAGVEDDEEDAKPQARSSAEPQETGSAKNQIVKDLERYINTLLEEILDDTVKRVSGTEGSSAKERKNSRNKAQHLRSLAKEAGREGKKARQQPSGDESSDEESSFDEISFSFHANEGNERKRESEEGYVNEGFVGSVDDPDSLDFRLTTTTTRPGRTFEQVECIDSGINSVETIEFQPDQEPSLEESLIRIIDEKLGRTPLKRSNEDIDATDPSGENENTESKEETKFLDTAGDDLAATEKVPNDEERKEDAPEPRKRNNSPLKKAKDISRSESSRVEAVEEESHVERGKPAASAAGGDDIGPHNLRETALDLHESKENIKESSFEKLRLEFTEDAEGAKGPSREKIKRNAMTKLREKLSGSFDKTEKEARSVLALPSRAKKDIRKDHPEVRRSAKSIELEDYRKKWPEGGRIEQSNPPRDSVISRRNRKPTIIFLHGFGSSAEIFAHQLEYFSALGYPCVAPDMLGHGMSSAPARKRDYHFSKLFKDLDAVLQHYALEPGQKCVIVAHNYGCSFAVALANKYECNIYQLVLISGGGPIPLGAPSTEGAGQCFLRAILAPFLLCGLHRDLLYTPIGRQHPYCGPEPPEQWPSHMKYILDGMIWPEGDSVFHKRVRTPTLLVHGLRDNKVSLVQECQMERAMAKAFLEAIPAAGHDPMTDCPDQLNHMIHCFIDLWKNRK